MHEDRSKLSPETLDLKRAIDSLREEFEAIDWYHQRSEATDDEHLKNIFLHNREEEFEHATMLLEWIRQHDPACDRYFRKYLFAERKDIASLE